MITPQQDAPDIARDLGLERLALKREDLHPYGSHKGRSIPVMIDLNVARGKTDFAISSSGNAALAAVKHIKARNALAAAAPGTPAAPAPLSLSVLVGEHIDPAKRAVLAAESDEHIDIEDAPRPLQALLRLVKGAGKTSLRQSTDDDALIGYRALAAEIAATPGLSAVFIGSSSGTAAQAIAEYFAEWSAKTGVPVPQVHIVQTTDTAPLVRALRSGDGHARAESGPVGDLVASLADAIVDKTAHRRDALVDAIRKTGGTGWIATNDDIVAAQRSLKEKSGIDATGNGALSLAGLIRALKDPATKASLSKGAVVCVITGK